jgi:hypothetical protein
MLGLPISLIAAEHSIAAPADSASGEKPRGNKAVIYVFLSGGLAQHESFDLKPEASAEVRGEFAPIQTRTPGIFICEHLPKLAERSNRWALLRSLTHPYNEHSNGHTVMLTGRTPMPPGYDPSKPKPTDWPSIAAIVGALVAPRGGLPSAVVLPDKIVHNSGRTIPGQFGGQMGTRHDPWFVEASPYHPKSYGAYPDYLFFHATGKVEDPNLVFQMPQFALAEGMTEARVKQRVALRQAIESQRPFFDRLTETEQLGTYRDAAYSLLLNDRAHDAFDVSRADPRRLDAYGRHSFGKSLLMAAELVEAGVSFVQVNLGNNETWDTHESAFPNLKNFLLPPLDQSLSALIDDLGDRGLLADTLIVVAGEFGRTPHISGAPGKLPGRNHWGAVQTVLFAGGKVQGEQVIGGSDNIGAYPAQAPHTPEDLAATIYHSLGLPTSAAWHDRLQRPHFIYESDPIAGLV